MAKNKIWKTDNSQLQLNNKAMTEDKLYSAIENAIIKWVIDGTKTAGSLTREIMLIIKQ